MAVTFDPAGQSSRPVSVDTIITIEDQAIIKQKLQAEQGVHLTVCLHHTQFPLATVQGYSITNFLKIPMGDLRAFLGGKEIIGEALIEIRIKMPHARLSADSGEDSDYEDKAPIKGKKITIEIEF